MTQYFSWRATFWFLAALMAVCLIAFWGAFRDTFRRERSVAYQAVLRRVVREREEKKKRGRERDSGETLDVEKMGVDVEKVGVDVQVGDVQDEKSNVGATTGRQTGFVTSSEVSPEDLEQGITPLPSLETQQENNAEVTLKEVHLSFKDVNPIPPLLAVLSRWNNVVILIASGALVSLVHPRSATKLDDLHWTVDRMEQHSISALPIRSCIPVLLHFRTSMGTTHYRRASFLFLSE